jgi:hypothetical protein
MTDDGRKARSPDQSKISMSEPQPWGHSGPRRHKSIFNFKGLAEELRCHDPQSCSRGRFVPQDRKSRSRLGSGRPDQFHGQLFASSVGANTDYRLYVVRRLGHGSAQIPSPHL